MIYPNLEAELARLEIKKVELAKLIGKSPNTIYSKLNGKTELTLSEARLIRAYIEKKKQEPVSFLRLYGIRD